MSQRDDDDTIDAFAFQLRFITVLPRLTVSSQRIPPTVRWFTGGFPLPCSMPCSWALGCRCRRRGWAGVTMGEVVQLPGTRRTVETVLAQTMDKSSRIKGVVIVIHWDDDTYDVDWSCMKTSELTMAEVTLRACVEDVVMGRDTASILVPRGGA